jgi:hypothetical protein
MRRVYFYIDGFNLYHALMDVSALRRQLWLNFQKLGESITSGNEQVAADRDETRLSAESGVEGTQGRSA